jgi:coatomer subunit beta
VLITFGKVSSTETVIIFGSILWEGPGMTEACVILNDIHIDIMDYIKPAYCNEVQVHVTRRHVQLFTLLTRYYTVPKYVEWENRVNVSTTLSGVVSSLASTAFQTSHIQGSTTLSEAGHVMKATNMSCLTPEDAMSDDFLSANMYARCVLLCLSIEQCSYYSITIGEDVLLEFPFSGHLQSILSVSPVSRTMPNGFKVLVLAMTLS